MQIVFYVGVLVVIGAGMMLVNQRRSAPVRGGAAT